MTKTVLDEIKEVVLDTDFKPVVVNFADDARNSSVTTVGALPEKADEEKVDKTKEDETTPSEKESEKTIKAEEKTKEKKTEVAEEEETIIEKPREIDPVQRRINEITKKRRIAERELDFERKKRIEVEREIEKLKNIIPATNKPKVEDFETEADFYEALTDWKIEQKLNIDKEKTGRESEEKKEKDKFAANLDAMEGKIEKGNEKYEDFSEIVLDENLKITEQMIEVVNSSEIAEDILYYLGKNPDISADIAKMNPVLATREILRIEAKITAPPLRKKTTNAPEPITPVKTNEIVEKTVQNRTLQEWKEWARSKH